MSLKVIFFSILDLMDIYLFKSIFNFCVFNLIINIFTSTRTHSLILSLLHIDKYVLGLLIESCFIY